MFITIDNGFYYTKIDWWDAVDFSCSTLSTKIFELIASSVSNECKVLFIDISYARSVLDHFETPIQKLLNKISIYLVYSPNTFTTENLAFIKTKISSTTQQNGDFGNDFKYVMLSNAPLNNLEQTANAAIEKLNEQLEKKTIELVEKSYRKFAKPMLLSSTPILASGEFNAMHFLSTPRNLKFIASGIAQKIYEHAKDANLSSITIVAASLRGALIAGAVWHILTDQEVLNVTIHVINHLGPKYDIMEDQIGSLRMGECIYIGDFVIAGTEAKTAATYCSIFGGKLSAVFAIGAVSDSNIIFSKTKLYKLIKLGKCIPTLSYQIK